MDFRDDEHCINTGGGYAEVIILICRTYRLVIHRNLKQMHKEVNVTNNPSITHPCFQCIYSIYMNESPSLDAFKNYDQVSYANLASPNLWLNLH